MILSLYQDPWLKTECLFLQWSHSQFKTLASKSYMGKKWVTAGSDSNNFHGHPGRITINGGCNATRKWQAATKLNPSFLWEFPTDFSHTIPSTFALKVWHGIDCVLRFITVCSSPSPHSPVWGDFCRVLNHLKDVRYMQTWQSEQSKKRTKDFSITFCSFWLY